MEIYKSVKVDLTVLDLVMPALGGVACAREMLALNPEAKIVFATGYDREKDLEKAEGLEMVPVLNKPFQISELNSTIRLLLD